MIKKANKSISQKLILSIICIMLIMNFAVPNYSHAGDILNNLFGPIKGLVCAIADSCMSLIQGCFIGDLDMITPNTIDHNDNDRWGGFLWFENGINWPTIKITPEEIFQGKIPALNVNFITEPSADLNTEYEKRKAEIQAQMDKLDPSSDAYKLLHKRLEDTATEQQDLALTTDDTQTALVSLRNTISRWYMTLRNIAIVGLLCVLVYVGIRMMLCSVASEKAKYKQMFMDWVIALCLIFFLHIIMAGIMTVTELITDIFSSSSVVGIRIMAQDQHLNGGTVNNLMEYVRLYVNLNDMNQSLAYIIIYVWLVVYTVKFIITYVKRFIHMAFLTMIAPLVALTYPIDKISDGKAQAFNMWLKDYIFNALIQPFHLIIYTVFVSSAIEFATNNLIYACVAIGFISQAEKFMRKMFGFDKAPNAPDSNGSFAGGAIAASLLNKATSAIGKGGSGGSGGNGGSGNDAPKPPKTQPDASGYIGDGGSPSGGSDPQGDSGSEDTPDQQMSPDELPEGQADNQQPGESDPRLNDQDMQSQLETGDEATGVEDDIDVADVDAGNADTSNEPDALYSGNETGQGQGGAPTTNRGPRASSQAQNNTGRRKIGGIKNVGKGLWKAGSPLLGKAAKAGLKGAGTVLGAAGGGLFALATGGDVAKGLMTGAGVGAGIGTVAGNIPKGIENAARGVKNTAVNARADFISATDKDRADEMKYRNNFMNNKAKQDYVKKYFKNADGGALSRAEVKEKMNQLYDYERAGITDIDTQQELMGMEDEKIQEGYSQENARQQVLYANKLASKYSKKDLIEKSEKYKEDQVATMMENGLSEAEARVATDKIFNDMYKIHGISAEGQRQKEQKRAQQKAEESQVAMRAQQKEQEKIEMQRRQTAAMEKLAGITPPDNNNT